VTAATIDHAKSLLRATQTRRRHRLYDHQELTAEISAMAIAVARTLGIDRKTVLKYAGHPPDHNGNTDAATAK
jgi:hypothetical protein